MYVLDMFATYFTITGVKRHICVLDLRASDIANSLEELFKTIVLSLI